MIVTDWFRLDNLLSQMELLSFDNVKKQKFHACNACNAMIGLEILLSNQKFSFQNPKPIMRALKSS